MRWIVNLLKGALSGLAAAMSWAFKNPIAAGAVGAGALIAGVFLEDGKIKDFISSVGWFFLTSAATGWAFHQVWDQAAGAAAGASDLVSAWWDTVKQGGRIIGSGLFEIGAGATGIFPGIIP